MDYLDRLDGVLWLEDVDSRESIASRFYTRASHDYDYDLGFVRETYDFLYLANSLGTMEVTLCTTHKITQP